MINPKFKKYQKNKFNKGNNSVFTNKKNKLRQNVCDNHIDGA